MNKYKYSKARIRYVVSHEKVENLTRYQIANDCPKSDSIVTARKKAIAYIKKHSFYEARIYDLEIGKEIGYVKEEILGNTPFSWNPYGGHTTALNKNGTLGKRW